MKYLVLTAGLLVVLAIVLTVTNVFGTHPQPAVNPLCTTASASALADYWNEQISRATYDNLQTIEQNAITATAQRIDYCKAHS